MEKLSVCKIKKMKLVNVLIKEPLVDEEINKSIIVMENYIKTKGGMPIGPLIQYVCPKISDEGELDLDIKFLRQSTTFIHNVEKPYTMESVIRVPNCLYVRYQGPQDKLQFAYQKLNLTAFEEDIPLKGDSYTVFVDNQDGIITADVFMERADNE